MAAESKSHIFRDSVTPGRGVAGVYAIINRLSLRIYIGSTVNLGSRKSQHRYDLKMGVHGSFELQQDFNNGSDFEFVVIEEVKDLIFLSDREQFWMDFYKSYNPSIGYNSHVSSESAKGQKKTDRMRKVLSNAHAGKPRPWKRRGVIQMDLSGNELARFESLTEASMSLGFSRPNGNIVSAAKGDYEYAYGFKWRYA